MTDSQEREFFFYQSSYIHEGFIPTVSLLIYLMKILVMAKIVFLNKQTNICWFKYKLRGFYDFTLRKIVANKEKVKLFSDSAPLN